MEVTSVTKSSDEIINELFTSLNVPLSPPLQTLDENVSITREALHSDTSNDNKEEGHSEDSITSGNETHGADRRRVKKSREKNTSDTDTKHRKKKKKRKKSHKKDDDYHKHKHKRKSKSKKKGDKEKSSTSVNETVCDDSLRDILDTAEIRISEDSTQKEKNSSIEKDSRTEVKSLLQKDKNSSVNKDRSKSRDRDRESSSKKNSSRHDLGWKKSTSTVNKRKRSRSPSPRSKTRTKDSVSRSSSRSRKRSKHSRSPVSESKQQKGRSWPSESLSRSPSSKKRLCSQSPTQEVRKENEDEQTCTLSTPKRLSEGEEGEGQESVIGKVSLDSIPLPLPAPLDIDPSSIPLPDTVSQPFLVVNKVEQLKTECENVVASSSVDSSNEKQSLETREDDTKKVKEEAGTDKNKSKVIVIKSLKDSIVFQLAQEEAERRAKERPQSSGEEETWEPNSSLEEEFDKLRSALCKVREEGEIVTSDEPEEEVKQEVEDKSKKLDKEEKKKRDKSKEKKTSKKKSSKKSKEKDKKKHKKEKEKKRKKKSRSSSRSRGRGRSKSEDAYYSKYRKRYSRSRSVSPYSRSRSPYERSRSRERKRNSHNDLRDKNARKRLLDIARRNAVYLVRHGCLPPSVEQEQLVKIQAGGKSVEELTDFCRQLVADGHYDELTDILSTEEEEKDEQAFSSSARHPFSIKDKPILMNIRNAPMLPTKTNKERLADNAMLRQQFPVSSGSQHRSKESEWIPVTPKGKKTAAEDDKVFPVLPTKTQPGKQAPGMFTGSTGAKIMSQEELASGYQAWAKKGQFNKAAPVSSRFGLKMLRKMGWKPGQGLGKNREGHIEPLKIDVKVDKKGFHAQEELTPKRAPIPMAKDLSGKHPVSALVELCCKRKWAPPDFEMVFDCGPDHKKNFLMKVKINGHEYKSSIAASTKKLAKAHAAAACLQSMGPDVWDVKENNTENDKGNEKPNEKPEKPKKPA